MYCIYLFARLFGFWPFSFDLQKNGKVCRSYVTAIDYIWFAISLSVYSFFIYFNDVEHYTVLPYSFVEVVASQLTLIGGVLIAMLSVVLDLWNRDRIRKIFVKLNEFDDEVH